ncbi:MAG: TylF/MycF/NovP-related O-methyltransferase [Pseudomonadota bacterium]
MATLEYTPDELAIIKHCNQLMERGEEVTVEQRRKALEAHVRVEPTRLDLAAQLTSVLVELKEPVPLELEESSLLFYVEQDETRPDLKERLNDVQRLLGRGEPLKPEVTQDGIEASQSEINFQEEARTYEQTANYDDMPVEFKETLEQCREFTMTSVERIYAMHQSVEYITRNQIPGAIVECGVWRGGSIMVAIKTLQKLQETSRQIYLYDTYDGLPKPDENLDVDMFGNNAIDGWIKFNRGYKASNWAYASLMDVKTNVGSLGYPEDKIEFVKGMVEDTIPATIPDQIALLRLDTDFYVSTKHELEHLYPRITPGGVLIIDDYGHFLGARSAVDEYISTLKIKPMLTRIDYSGRLSIVVGH